MTSAILTFRLIILGYRGLPVHQKDNEQHSWPLPTWCHEHTILFPPHSQKYLDIARWPLRMVKNYALPHPCRLGNTGLCELVLQPCLKKLQYTCFLQMKFRGWARELPINSSQVWMVWLKICCLQYKGYMLLFNATCVNSNVYW